MSCGSGAALGTQPAPGNAPAHAGQRCRASCGSGLRRGRHSFHSAHGSAQLAKAGKDITCSSPSVLVQLSGCVPARQEGTRQ